MVHPYIILSTFLGAFLISACGIHRPGYDRELGGWPSSHKSKPKKAHHLSKAEIKKVGIKSKANSKKGQGLKSAIKPWLGTPYSFGGNKKGSGTDCSGFVQGVYWEWKGILLPRTSGQMFQTGKSINRGSLKSGDLVFFGPGWSVNHVGIYVGNGLMAHASSSKGVEYRELDNPYWKKRYKGARRL